MKDYEKQIEEAAIKCIRGNDAMKASPYSCFIEGAKSPETKEYWQQGMYTKENLKAAWNSGYNKAISSINEDRFDEDDTALTFDEWFDLLNKKK